MAKINQHLKVTKTTKKKKRKSKQKHCPTCGKFMK